MWGGYLSAFHILMCRATSRQTIKPLFSVNDFFLFELFLSSVFACYILKLKKIDCCSLFSSGHCSSWQLERVLHMGTGCPNGYPRNWLRGCSAEQWVRDGCVLVFPSVLLWNGSGSRALALSSCQASTCLLGLCQPRVHFPACIRYPRALKLAFRTRGHKAPSRRNLRSIRAASCATLPSAPCLSALHCALCPDPGFLYIKILLVVNSGAYCSMRAGVLT